MSDRKKLLKLSYPIYFESLLFSIIGSMDTLMLSKYSDVAVGAVGVVNQFLFLIQIAGNIIIAGTGILLAQYIGAGKSRGEIQKLTLSALFINLILGILFSSLIVVLHPTILSFLNIDGQMLAFAKDYMVIIGSFLFLQLISITFSMFLRAHGKTRTTFKVSFLMNLINVLLNYVLIYGKLGLPSMGVAGAAWATVISKGIGLVILGLIVYKMAFQGFPVHYSRQDFRAVVPKILHYGAPAAGEQISYTLAKFIMMIFITKLGEDAITAYSYSNTLVSFVYVFAVSLGQGTSIMVGWHMGAKEKEKANGLTLYSARVSFLVSMTFCTVLVLFRVPLLGILTDNKDIIALAGTVLLYNFIVEAGRSQNLIFVNALRASGDVRFPFYMSVVSMWSIGVLLSYVFTFTLSMGLPGIWLALGLDELFRSIFMRLRWRNNFRMLTAIASS
jgi:putative MATE family efflux protein